MSTIKLNKMTMDTAWEVPWKCWELMKQNYVLALGLGIILILFTLTGSIPFLGPIISGPLLFAWAIGILFVAKEWESGQESSFQTFIKEFTNIERIIRFAPLLVISIVTGMASQLAVNAGMSFAVLGFLSIFTFAVGFIIGMMVNQMVFHTELTVQQSLDNAMKAIGQNLGPIILVWIIYWLLAFICTILLFLPMIFAFLPMMTSFNYILYRVLFEGLELKSEEKQQDI